MAKQLLKEIAPHIKLYRDTRTGIAWVENGSTGNGHSPHPNIDASGSVAGMKKQGYWDQTDQTVRSHGFIYNISVCSVEDQYDEIARQHCQCGGNHSRHGDINYVAGKLQHDLSNIRRISGVVDVGIVGEVLYIRVDRVTFRRLEADLVDADTIGKYDAFFAADVVSPFDWTGVHKVGQIECGVIYQADIENLIF